MGEVHEGDAPPHVGVQILDGKGKSGGAGTKARTLPKTMI
jgi:hypothetical protein